MDPLGSAADKSDGCPCELYASELCVAPIPKISGASYEELRRIGTFAPAMRLAADSRSDCGGIVMETDSAVYVAQGFG